MNAVFSFMQANLFSNGSSTPMRQPERLNIYFSAVVSVTELGLSVSGPLVSWKATWGGGVTLHFSDRLWGLGGGCF